MAKRWQERHEFYRRALAQLTSGLAAYLNLNELEKDDVIQRFEFTFDLAWKTLQDYFTQEAGYADIKGPRTVLKQAVQDNLITGGYTWLSMLTSRNELTHVYDESESHRILDDIADTYLPLLQAQEQVISRKV